MIEICAYQLISNPSCQQAIVDPLPADFYYYDKDGFELNLAERKYYQAQGYALDDCLNHLCCQETWMAIGHPSLFFDHSLILHRANYSSDARAQLEQLKVSIPAAGFLLDSRQKWGYDFALDAVIDQQVFEVLHVEYDSLNYQEFLESLKSVEQRLSNIDWVDAAQHIFDKKDQWESLSGFEQNHWKAQQLLGWQRAEYTEKAI